MDWCLSLLTYIKRLGILAKPRIFQFHKVMTVLHNAQYTGFPGGWLLVKQSQNWQMSPEDQIRNEEREDLFQVIYHQWGCQGLQFLWARASLSPVEWSVGWIKETISSLVTFPITSKSEFETNVHNIRWIRFPNPLLFSLCINISEEPFSCLCQMI